MPRLKHPLVLRILLILLYLHPPLLSACSTSFNRIEHHSSRGGGGAPIQDTHCYSCMSRYYGATWQFAGYSRIYEEPISFTEHCRDPQARGADVHSKQCKKPGSTCVTMIEELKIGTGARGYIRGCFDSILLFGFNSTGTVGALGGLSFCHTFNLTELVAGGRPEESSINLCSCRGSLCNGSPINSSSFSFNFFQFFFSFSFATQFVILFLSLNF